MKKLGFLGVFLPLILLGQPIEIDWTEIPASIGTLIINNQVDSVTVALGDTGGPQTFDFTTQPMGTDSTMDYIIDLSSAPYPDSFPSANIVHRMLIIGAETDSQFYYERLVEDSLNGLGVVVWDPTVGGLCLVFRPVAYTPLPLSYGTSWSDSFSFKFKYMGFDVFITHHRYHIVDAYGTVQIPYGDFPALRICGYDTIHQWIPGIVNTTLTWIEYYYVTEDYGSIASVRSYEGETNPNFTKGNLSRTTYFEVGVEEKDVTDDAMVSEWPNPFGGRTSIRYQTASKGKVLLEIYDISGRLVKVLVNEVKGIGVHKVSWDGKDERSKRVPGGIYFYRLITGNKVVNRKLVLIR